MVKAYDDWERLVAAVLRREELWQLFHQDSLSTVPSSSSSSSFRLSSSFSNLDSFNFSNSYGQGFPKYAQLLPFGALARVNVNVDSEKDKQAGLVLFEGSPYTFGFQELLMAPSFVLGEDIDTFYSTYAVSLRESFFVVKRFRKSNVSRDKLMKMMQKFGRIEHENVGKLNGYCFSGDEHFGVYDYYPRGSVRNMLVHGKRDENGVELPWETRMKIARGAAKGLAYIHTLNITYGNVKSSNIFLNLEGNGCLGEFHIGELMSSGYYSPSSPDKFTPASDTYSFGVFLLELLSGRSPMRRSGRYWNWNFVEWAHSKARDEWVTLVFDAAVVNNPLVKQEMQELLSIALSCVEEKPQKRPTMKDVERMIDLIFEVRKPLSFEGRHHV